MNDGVETATSELIKRIRKDPNNCVSVIFIDTVNHWSLSLESQEMTVKALGVNRLQILKCWFMRNKVQNKYSYCATKVC